MKKKLSELKEYKSNMSTKIVEGVLVELEPRFI